MSEFQLSQAKIDRSNKIDWPLVVITLVIVVPVIWMVAKRLG